MSRHTLVQMEGQVRDFRAMVESLNGEHDESRGLSLPMTELVDVVLTQTRQAAPGHGSSGRSGGKAHDGLRGLAAGRSVPPAGHGLIVDGLVLRHESLTSAMAETALPDLGGLVVAKVL